jgi:hypothetical protein
VIHCFRCFTCFIIPLIDETVSTTAFNEYASEKGSVLTGTLPFALSCRLCGQTADPVVPLQQSQSSQQLAPSAVADAADAPPFFIGHESPQHSHDE